MQRQPLRKLGIEIGRVELEISPAVLARMRGRGGGVFQQALGVIAILVMLSIPALVDLLLVARPLP